MSIIETPKNINTPSAWATALKAKYGPEQCTNARKALGLPSNKIPEDQRPAMERWLGANAKPLAAESVEEWEIETERSALHIAALAYVARGVPVFPCRPDGKAPACAHGHKDATTDVEQINAWWLADANHNIGLEPERIGQCVIDIDPGAEPQSFPDTYEVRTPRGGSHLYYKGSLPPTAGKLAQHVDTRGRNSYVLVPPSVVDGKPYAVLHDRPLAELPPQIAQRCIETNTSQKAVVDDLDQDANVARARTLLAGSVKRGDVAIEGQGGNNRTYRLAAEVQALGISPETCLKLMAEWNEHCQPAWPADELARIVNNATEYMQNEAGANAVGSAIETFGDAVANLPAISESVGVSAPIKINLINPVPFSTLMSRPLKPIQEIIPGLIEKGVATMLAGPGGTHKSRLALQWGLSIQAGIPVFGKPVERCTFVYLDYENGSDEITRRTHKMQYRLKLPPDTQGHYHDFTGKSAAVSPGPLPTSELSPPVALIEETGITCCPLYFQLFGFLRSIPGHKLVVADSTYNILRFAGQTKINESAVKAALNLLDYLCAATDSTLIYLWHPSQAGQERGDASGWSVAWHNTPRARLSLSKDREATDAFKLKVEKRNNGPEGAEITLHWRDGILLPLSEIDAGHQASLLFEACIAAALTAAEHDVPIKKGYQIEKWLFDGIEKAAGFRPTPNQIKNELATAVGKGRLRYIKGSSHQKAGYFPVETDPELLRTIGVDTAREQSRRGDVATGPVAATH